MRRILILIYLCLSSEVALALPVLNPWEYALLNYPSSCLTSNSWKCFSFRAGFLGDYVLNRRLETTLDSDIYQTMLQTYQGTLTLNWRERFELYAGLGSSQIALSTPASSFNYRFAGTLQIIDAIPGTFASNNFPFFDPNSLLSVNSTAAFSCSAGVSAIPCCYHNFALSTSGHYFYTNPPIANVILPPTMGGNALINGGAYGGSAPMMAPSTVYLSNTFNYQEWQADLCLAYALCISRMLKVIPFIAIEWAGVLVDFGNAIVSTATTVPPTVAGFAPVQSADPFTANLYNLKQQRLFGYTIGTSFVGRDRFAAGIEWRLVNESAFCVDLNVSF